MTVPLIGVTDTYGNTVHGVRITWNRIERAPLRLGRAMHRAWRKSRAYWPKSKNRFHSVIVQEYTT